MIHVKFEMFLDRSDFIRRLDRKRQRVFFRLGGWCMKKMRNSMKNPPKKESTRKRHRQQGVPPYKHSGLLKERIYFGIQDDTLIVGPEKMNVARNTKPLNGLASIPQLLNEGGDVMQELSNGVMQRRTYAPRPFTAPVQQAGERKYVEFLEREGL